MSGFNLCLLGNLFNQLIVFCEVNAVNDQDNYVNKKAKQMVEEYKKNPKYRELCNEAATEYLENYLFRKFKAMIKENSDRNFFMEKRK